MKKTVIPQKKSETVKTVKKRGRPALGRMRAAVLQIRMSGVEKALLSVAAAKAGVSLHAHCRTLLGLDAAR